MKQEMFFHTRSAPHSGVDIKSIRMQPNKCVHELFETQVERTPNAVALVYSKGEVSYRELDYQANRVAIHLRSLGVGPDVPVGICVQRSADTVVDLSH